MGQRTCPFPGCTKPVHANDLCSGHDQQRRKGKTLTPLRPTYGTFEERFWAKVEPTEGCWWWIGSRNYLGYGQIQITGVGRRGAHRVSYEMHVGPIPAWATDLDHLCRNPSCVNPYHLEPVTHAENMRRAPWSAVQFQAAKQVCPQGHDYTPENTYLRRNSAGTMSRECRTCRRARRKAWAA